MMSKATTIYFLIAALLGVNGALAAPINLSDDDCLAKIDEYFSSIEIPDGVTERVMIARKYYNPDGIFVAPVKELESIKDCKKFEDGSLLDEVKEHVPCSVNFSKRNDNALKVIVNSSEGAKNVLEACFACMSGHYSFAMMNLFGILDEYLDRAVKSPI